MIDYGKTDATRERLGLLLPAKRPSLISRLRIALEIILGLLLLLCAYGWHQERDIADHEQDQKRIAEQRLSSCMGCAQSWEDYKAANNHRGK